MSKKSLSQFGNELSEFNQQLWPLEWTSMQGTLASELLFLGQQTSDEGVLNKLIDELRVSFENCNKEKDPQDWAINNNKLADAIHAKTQRDKSAGVKLLNESLDAYMNLLTVWKRQEVPSDWASTFNKLGMLFKALGERTQGERALEKSIAAFNNALTHWTQEDTPDEWAVCQNNMGVSLHLLAEYRQDLQILGDSVECYEKALQVIAKDQSPVGWVVIIANLGDAQIILAEQLGDKEFARKAVTDFDKLVDYFRAAHQAEHLSLAKKQRDKAQKISQKIAI